MSKNVTSPYADLSASDASVKKDVTPVGDIKSEDHGAFRVHVQIFGHEWWRAHQILWRVGM